MLEEFLRKNIEVIFEDETLIVVGKQVVNKENGRSDLTAADENGNLVLIEIKRDIEDIIQRKETFEFQAIRFLIRLSFNQQKKERTVEILVHRLLKWRNIEFKILSMSSKIIVVR